MYLNLNLPTSLGYIQKIRLVSKNICRTYSPQEREDVEQHLVLYRNGRVFFSAYQLVNDSQAYHRSQKQWLQIPQNTAETAFDYFLRFFVPFHKDETEPDVGSWTLELTNSEGMKFHFKGPLYPYPYSDYHGLSILLRRLLRMDQLWIFEGNTSARHIDRISIDYTRTKIEVQNEALGMPLNYAERLVLDRSSRTLEYRQSSPHGKLIQQFELTDEVDDLLNQFHPYRLFRSKVTVPDDIIYDPYDSKMYRITIDYSDRTQHSVYGSFDRDNLPPDYEPFIFKVEKIIKQYHCNELFQPALYKYQNQRKSEYLYCGVRFENSYKIYHYISDDRSVKIGDYVIVPVGSENKESIAQVAESKSYDILHAPYPVEKTKHIIRKCTEEELYEWRL